MKCRYCNQDIIVELSNPTPNQDWLDEIYVQFIADSVRIGSPQAWDKAKQAITQHLNLEIKRARLAGLEGYKRQCGMLRVEPTTQGLNAYIKSLEGLEGGE